MLLSDPLPHRCHLLALLERPMTTELGNSFKVGYGVGFVAGGASAARRRRDRDKDKGFSIPSTEDAKLARFKEALKRMKAKAGPAPGPTVEAAAADEAFAPKNTGTQQTRSDSG